MYLKQLSMENFRKFGSNDNFVQFAKSRKSLEDSPINIASNTTLIVGKNNSGKTTVIEALRRLLGQDDFKATDFNLTYLNGLLKKYDYATMNEDNIEFPKMEFDIKVVIEDDEMSLVTNLIPFLSLSSVHGSEITINVVVSVSDKNLYYREVKKLIEKKEIYQKQFFYKYMELLNDIKFSATYYDEDNEECKDFRLNQLVELESIAANNIVGSNSLSEAFSKIIEYRYKVMEETQAEELTKNIVGINESLSDLFDKQYARSLNDALGNIIDSEKCKVLLRSDLNFQKLIKTVVKYEYAEGNQGIPENQFGLGYTNLMMIIASIIGYVEKHQESAFSSQINLIAIEEPETFMHPQMQEMFIRDINETINVLLAGKHKEINSQIIITTHSSYILNCKIFDGNSFDNINYIKEKGKKACVVVLSDEAIIDESDKREENLNYIKKHITFGMSNLFFADAAIFVEGNSEYVLLKQFLSDNEELRHKYIALNIINGAHAYVYHKLFKLLGIPIVIITDIDFERADFEKREKKKENGKDCCYLQMTAEEVGERATTNATLKHFMPINKAKDILEKKKYEEDNIGVFFQKDLLFGYYATSFEEAFILTNYNRFALQKTLEKVLPNLYKALIKENKDDIAVDEIELNIKNNSFHLQRSLGQKKTDFANELLYKIITGEDQAEELRIPAYIEQGIDFIKRRLG